MYCHHQTIWSILLYAQAHHLEHENSIFSYFYHWCHDLMILLLIFDVLLRFYYYFTISFICSSLFCSWNFLFPSIQLSQHLIYIVTDWQRKREKLAEFNWSNYNANAIEWNVDFCERWRIFAQNGWWIKWKSTFIAISSSIYWNQELNVRFVSKFNAQLNNYNWQTNPISIEIPWDEWEKNCSNAGVQWIL